MLSDDEYDAIRLRVEHIVKQAKGGWELARDLVEREYEGKHESREFASDYLTSFQKPNAKVSEQPFSATVLPKLTRIDKNDAICSFTLLEPANNVSPKGFARYWKAESKHSTTTFFVKYFRDNHETRKARSNLSVLAEYQILRNFRDDNIANVFDAGWVRDEAGVEFPFVATQWLDGCTLTEWRLKHCPEPSLLQAAEIAWVVASALMRILKFQEKAVKEALGDSKILKVFHLDIKPDNVMVQKDASGSVHVANEKTIKVVDFGSAGLPEMATAAGTYHYKAPERFSGAASSPNPTWDVYSVGGLLYFLITGVDPEPADPKLPKEQWENWYNNISFEHGDLTRVVRKCLAYSPDQRYPSAVELEEDLYRIVQGFPLIYARREYSLPTRLWMLLLRSRRRNDVNDHSMVLGIAALPIAVAVTYMWISHIVQVNQGIPPADAYLVAGFRANVFAGIVCLMTLWLVRWQAFSQRMLISVLAFVLSLPIIIHLFAPSRYGGSPNWDQFVQGGMYVILELALVNIALGSHHKFWKSCYLTGWVMFVAALFVRPVFESQFKPIAMPVVVGILEAFSLLAFARNTFIEAPKREDRNLALRYF